VHVYFPDPWWKKRHHKRRLFTPEFLDETTRVLEPGGRLYFVSDVEAYYQTVHDMVSRHPRFEMVPPPELSSPSHDFDYLTNFDRKFRKEGRPIYRLSARLTATAKKITQETPPSRPT
jgi:tRNA (guanine-N7-)-methyltransferase